MNMVIVRKFLLSENSIICPLAGAMYMLHRTPPIPDPRFRHIESIDSEIHLRPEHASESVSVTYVNYTDMSCAETKGSDVLIDQS